MPCEYLAVDVSDLTGVVRHNISKDILKWRLNAKQVVLGDSMAVAVKEAKAEDASRHENHDVFFDEEDEPEPADRAWSKCRLGGATARRPSLLARLQPVAGVAPRSQQEALATQSVSRGVGATASPCQGRPFGSGSTARCISLCTRGRAG